MKPVRTVDTNAVFKLKGGTSENDLPIERVESRSQGMQLVSTWELADYERKMVAEGGRIQLCVWGEGHPPVSLMVVPSGE